MKTALVTTTINVPTVLELYRQHGPDVRFFVAGDIKSPHVEIEVLLRKLDGGLRWIRPKLDYDNEHDRVALSDALYLSPQAQKEWKCSEPIGWNCIQRRNIALLEAIKWGADCVISIDDDNIPMDGYFGWFQRALFKYDEWIKWSGVKVSSPNGWFDPGQLLTPSVRHRGLPIEVPTVAPRLTHAVGAKVGVAVGLWVGDGDVDATHRIAHPPAIHSATELAQCGVVVDSNTKTVFNAQNTAFIRELAPAMFMMPGVGRYDDIYASLICQRVMRERGYHVHFGKPFTACWQDRSTASKIADLRGEIDGMENVDQLARYLDLNTFSGGTLLDQLRSIYLNFDKLPHSYAIVPKQAVDAALAFLDDIEAVL